MPIRSTKNTVLAVFIIFLCLLSNKFFAQNKAYSFSHITNENGLSNNIINHIIKDSRGFMWIATDDGLNRYDGYEFVVYKNIFGDSTSLCTNRVEVIFEDSDNDLWVGTPAGLNKYNRDLDNFEQIGNKSAKGGLIFHHIKDIAEYNNELYIATRGGGINIYNKTTKTFSYILHSPTNPESLSTDIIYSIFTDSDNRIWFGTRDEGIDLLDSKTGKLRHFKFNLNLPLYNRVRCMLELRKNEYLVGTDAGLLKLIVNKNTHNVKQYLPNETNTKAISRGHIRELFKDSTGIIWVGAQYGLHTFNVQTESFSKIKNNKDDVYSLHADEIWSIMQDDQGLLWFGSYKEGLSTLNINQQNFRNWKYDATNPKSLINNSVLAIEENKQGKLWLSIDHGGLSLFDKNSGTIKTFTHNKNIKGSLPNTAVLSLLSDNEDNLWLGLHAGGLYFKKNGSNSFKALCPKQINPQDWHIWDLMLDSQGRLWQATLGKGVSFYNTNKQTFTVFPANSKDSTSISSETTWYVFEDKSNTIWIATANGLNKYNEATQTFTHYPYQKGENIRKNYTVNIIFEDSKNRLWLGTNGLGLNLFNRETGHFEIFTKKQGLPNNVVHGILEDEHMNLWLSTNNGICKFSYTENASTVKTINFNKTSGLQGNIFNRGSVFKTKLGELVFGHNKGFVLFHPDSIKPNMAIPKVVLTAFSILNKKIEIAKNNDSQSPLKKSINELKEITLNHKQSVFSIKYAAMSYNAPLENKYAYMLEGFDNNWNYVGTKREATYTNLNAGKYIFKVRAANNNGKWSNNSTKLIINILPPWWKTIWFRIIEIIVILLVLFIIYRLRVYALRKQKRLLKTKVDERTNQLLEANTQLKKQQREIQNQNNELVQSEEELTQLNEQLYSSNELLNKQKLELESALSKLQDTQLQLIESEKMATVGILTAGIAHEINNPLNFIQGGKTSLSMYINEFLGDHAETIEPFIDMIDEGISRATSIVGGLNRFNRSSENYNEACDVHLIIDNCLVMLQNTLKYNIELSKEFANAPVMVKGNEGELHQVFINIISNAIYAVKQKGNISIETSSNELISTIKITDNGEGIPKQNIGKITDPFFTTKPPGEGTGLGMSIAYSIIKKHKGTIIIRSEENIGTTIIITLPAMG